MKKRHLLSRDWTLSGEQSKFPMRFRQAAVGVGSASLAVAPAAMASLDMASGETRVNVQTGEFNSFGSRRAQGVAVAPDGDAVVVWRRTAYQYFNGENDNDPDVVFARIFDQSGTPKTGEIPVGEGTDPSVAVDGAGNFVVGWETRFDPYNDSQTKVVLRLFDASGNPTSGVVDVDTVTLDDPYSDDVVVAMNPTGSIVATWERCCNEDSYENDIMVRTFDANGTPTSAPVQANTGVSGAPGFAQEAAVGMDADGDFAVTWHWNADDYYSETVFVRTFDADASPTTAEQVVGVSQSGASPDPDLAMNLAGDFVVSFDPRRDIGGGYTERDVKIRIYNEDGSPRTSLIDVALSADGRPQDASVAMGDDRIAVAWHANLSGEEYGADVFFRTFTTEGSPQGPAQRVHSAVSGSQTDPSVGMDPRGNVVAVAWEDNADYEDAQDVFIRSYSEAQPIPTLDRFGLLLMAGLTGLLGFFGLRRRRVH